MQHTNFEFLGFRNAAAPENPAGRRHFVAAYARGRRRRCRDAHILEPDRRCRRRRCRRLRLWGDRALGLLGVGPGQPHYLGYVEGETTLVAPPIAGRLVDRPSSAAAGSRRATSSSPSTRPRPRPRSHAPKRPLPRPRRATQNMLTGKRPEEQDVIRARRRRSRGGTRAGGDRSSNVRPSCWQGASARTRPTNRPTPQVGQLRARSASAHGPGARR